MNYMEMVSETWRHRELGSSPHVYRELVRYATLAASSHNTQPWIFKLEPNQIQVLPDLSRRCPAVDPDDHHLYASLGCATENLLLATRRSFRTRPGLMNSKPGFGSMARRRSVPAMAFTGLPLPLSIPRPMTFPTGLKRVGVTSAWRFRPPPWI